MQEIINYIKEFCYGEDEEKEYLIRIPDMGDKEFFDFLRDKHSEIHLDWINIPTNKTFEYINR